MNTAYPLKALNQTHPLLIGFRRTNGPTQKEVSERLGVTQQIYARLEADPASANAECLFGILAVLGVEMILFPGSQVPSSMSSSTMEESEQQKDSPARWGKW